MIIEYFILWFSKYHPDKFRVLNPDAFYTDEEEALNEIAFQKKKNPDCVYILCEEVGRLEDIVFKRCKSEKIAMP